ncbi:hypothetical protein MLD38_035968 [Melastoma candidum]|uniref:Uncharacterized protein n=1 Tax=Melastoma candidum TaxID=119954 RepID=A0ACB9LIE6_9MYRT|nr:hypothetical protein MLD38_035968 [Melastoma candidum]
METKGGQIDLDQLFSYCDDLGSVLRDDKDVVGLSDLLRGSDSLRASSLADLDRLSSSIQGASDLTSDKGCLCLALGFVRAVLGDLSPTPSPNAPAGHLECPLNFSAFPYKPTGECIGPRAKATYWGSYRTTDCCQNALVVLSQMLASLAWKTQGNIFIPKQQWKSCSSYLLHQQTERSNLCNFESLASGSSYCSSLTLKSVTGMDSYERARKNCSNFGTSYEETCTACSVAVISLRDDLLREEKENDSEKAICGVAAVIAVAATNIEDASWVDSFYRCLPALDKEDSNYIKVSYSVFKVLLAMFIALIGVILVISLIKYVNKRQKPSPPPPPPTPRPKDLTMGSSLYQFSKAEIEKAIKLCNKKSLGKGSAGEVFKGLLPSGQVVAIKHITESNTSDTFKREIDGLSRVRHPNLVSLLGFCIEEGKQYLVYEYCASGNLASHLLKEDALLTWERRVKILRDCVLALKYLHHFINGCIVHRDIKLTNILLTEKLEPKLSDFGLAKILGMEESKVFTDVRGTIGYMDPEYMSNARLTCASDIYSFGIVALQVLSGQKVIELDVDARDQLTRKAKDVTMGKRPSSDFEDPRLEEKFNREDFDAILQVAVFCVAKLGKERPTINAVFEEIDKVWQNIDPDKVASLTAFFRGCTAQHPICIP